MAKSPIHLVLVPIGKKEYSLEFHGNQLLIKEDGAVFGKFSLHFIDHSARFVGGVSHIPLASLRIIGQAARKKFHELHPRIQIHSGFIIIHRKGRPPRSVSHAQIMASHQRRAHRANAPRLPKP